MTKDELEQKIVREVYERFGGDAYAWRDAKLAENETFRGEELNGEKLARLMRIKELCMKLPEFDDEIENRFCPFCEKDRFGTATIRLSATLLSCDRRVMDGMKQLFAEADGFSLSYADGKMRISFHIQDMWNKKIT